MARPRVVSRSAAAVIVVGFFMPWAQLFGFGASGYQMAKLGSYGNLAWLVPAAGVITLLLDWSGSSSRKVAGMAAGILPWLALVVGLRKVGYEIFQVLAIGAYVVLAASVVLIVATVNEEPAAENKTAESGAS